jgi:integrase
MKAASLTNADVDRYIEKKQREGFAPATINRMLQLVSQAYKKAIERGEIDRAPKFRHLSEAGNERRGFFERAEFDAVSRHLPPDIADFSLFCFLSGWRKGEAASIEWGDVEGNLIRLRATHSKNGESRSIAIAGELVALMARRREARLIGGTTLAQFVFHRNGAPIQEFRKSWGSACKKAGVNRLFHDLRRSAVRNMIRSGVPQSIAMKISGHKTASMFRRYDIASEDDLRSAIEAVQRYHEAAQQKIVSMTS